jgi:hypothetical protein
VLSDYPTRKALDKGQYVAKLKLSPGAALYLELLESAVSGRLIEDPSIHPNQKGFDAGLRHRGWDWPQYAHTMVGTLRLRNLRFAVEQVLHEEIAGDLLETGVWRGGACIFMRGILAAYGVRDRTVWVCDSFRGLPPPNPEEYPADEGDETHTYTALSVPMEQVRRNFQRYGLLDRQVRFVQGWFKDTLPGLAVNQIAILRLDGDMYESTMNALRALYSKLSLGGFLIVDDYALPRCQAAVRDFRASLGIKESIIDIDGIGAFWQKER